MVDVSVVIPAYKCRDLVARAVRSALDQRGVAAEIIVVVDEPCEETRVAAACAGATIALVNEVNRGAQFSRNRGLALCSAPAVLFLDADDYVSGDLLQGLVAAQRDRDADVVLGPWTWLNPELGWRRNVPAFSSPAELISSLLEEREFTPTCATLWRTDFCRSIGGWDEAVDRFTDLDMSVRAMLLGGRLAQSAIGEGIYFDHPSPHRMSFSLGSVASALHIAESLLSIDSEVIARESLRAGLGKFLYRNAMLRLRRRQYEEFRTLIRRSRALGHAGRRHRVAGSLAAARIDALLGTRLHERLRSNSWPEKLSPASSRPRPAPGGAGGP